MGITTATRYNKYGIVALTCRSVQRGGGISKPSAVCLVYLKRHDTPFSRGIQSDICPRRSYDNNNSNSHIIVLTETTTGYVRGDNVHNRNTTKPVRSGGEGV